MMAPIGRGARPRNACRAPANAGTSASALHWDAPTLATQVCAPIEPRSIIALDVMTAVGTERPALRAALAARTTKVSSSGLVGGVIGPCAGAIGVPGSVGIAFPPLAAGCAVIAA